MIPLNIQICLILDYNRLNDFAISAEYKNLCIAQIRNINN